MTQRAYNLSTDLYQMTMAAAYFDNGISHQAMFELFVRSLPKRRSYLIAAGIEQALDYLKSLRFSADEIDYLREHTAFKHVSREFFEYLRDFRFTGDVWAMPEGTAVFANEPILKISAPVIEAQIVETFLLSTINFQTMIAGKAARVVTAAGGRNCIEFGTRRAHGSEAGLMAARAAYIGGCVGTSNVEAGFLFGIPTMGTLAHSFIMLFDKEDDAFKSFLKVFPETATILVDTYDTLAAVERLATSFSETIQGIRLDSGDLAELSIKARDILDREGKISTKIFASSDLDEFRISEMIAKGAKIDAFGVGTQLATSYDAPAISGVYKLVGIEKDGKVSLRMKLSHDKATLPGMKQLWRKSDSNGRYVEDVIALADEEPPETDGSWHSLLEPVMQAGQMAGDYASLDKGSAKADREARFDLINRARARALEELTRMPKEILALETDSKYQVRLSQKLSSERDRLLKEKTVRPKGDAK
jgi:nicotinate phosphoribosyltransferase